MFDYSADNIIQSIRDLGYIGDSARDWPDVKMLRLLNRQVAEYMLPLMLKARKEYFVTYADQTLVASQAAYYLPSKATAEKIRAVQLVDASGNPYAGLVEMDLERGAVFGSNQLLGSYTQGTPEGYYFRGNQLVLVPVPAANLSLSLRIHYAARPSSLVLKASCVALTNLTGGGGAASGFFRIGIGATVPAGYIVGAACDLVQNVPGFDVLFTGAITAISAGNYVEFAGTLPTQLAAGDWLCLADTAPVVTGGVPEFVVGCLVGKVTLETMAKKTAPEDFTRRLRLLQQAEKEAVALLSSRRNAGDHTKVGAGALNRFRRGGGGGYPL